MAIRGWPTGGLCLLIGVLGGAAMGQEFVPFVIPTTQSDRSMVAMPPGPAIAVGGDRPVARDGHFWLKDKRFRVWGVNVCFGANFPTHADAQRVAARLAGGGVNCVRFHHMDTSNYPNGIWDPKQPGKLHPEAVDRLDYFIDQLARHGIYANINLHVGHSHARVLGLPEADKLPEYDKIVDIFTPELIDAQQRYARELLTHVNVYRKVRYADDPAVAFVEITNEDSLFMWGADSTLRSLPPHYAGILQNRYLAWLRQRYGATDALRAAWGNGDLPLGENLLAGLKQPRWRLEQHEGCIAQLTPMPNEADAVRVAITKADAMSWHVQINQVGLSIKRGQYYTLTFRARADKPRRIDCSFGQAHEPWQGLGWSGSVQLSQEWKEFRFGMAALADDANGRINFSVGGSEVAVELAEVAFRLGGREGLGHGESLEPGNVALFAASETEPRTLDRLRFLTELEKSFFDAMYGFIKRDLGAGALVTGTIVFGPCGLYGQSGMDYIDGHAYWHHPSFPGRPWDPENWHVEQEAMTDHPDESPLFRLACERLAGKPYTVSEYNHPAPNDYQAETVPTVASFAALQDWDGIWLFAYSHTGQAWDRQAFSSFFDIDANPAKWGFMPAGAAIFRDGAIAPILAARTVSLASDGDALSGVTRMRRQHGDDLYTPVLRAGGLKWKDLPQTRLAVALDSSARLPEGPATQPGEGAASTLTWRASGKTHGVFHAAGAGAVVWVGQRFSQADLSPTLPLVSAPEFVAMTITAMDGLPLGRSRKILITACGRCENTGMEFSVDRRTVGRSWGRPPVRIQAVTGQLASPPELHTLLQLGPDGQPLDQAPGLSPKSQTMWYLYVPK